MSLHNQVVLVTGGTRGIGRAIALRLAQESPAHVIVTYRSNYQTARATVNELQDLGVEASCLGLDVSKPEMIDDLFTQIDETHGRLDIFINNAALTSFRPAMELNTRTWQRIIDINARAFLLGAQAAASLMQKNSGGKIIAISSLGSRFCLPMYAGLGAAKAALEALARYLAVELAPSNIQVNVVNGGLIDTESMHLAPNYETMMAKVAARTPMGRVGQPEDMAGVVAFLCSPDGAWLCGQTLVADGGYSLRLEDESMSIFGEEG